MQHRAPGTWGPPLHSNHRVLTFRCPSVKTSDPIAPQVPAYLCAKIGFTKSIEEIYFNVEFKNEGWDRDLGLDLDLITPVSRLRSPPHSTRPRYATSTVLVILLLLICATNKHPAAQQSPHRLRPAGYLRAQLQSRHLAQNHMGHSDPDHAF